MQEKNKDFSILKLRILEYLDYKKVNKTDVYTKAGLTHGILSQKNGISEDNLLKFLNYYSEINKDWFFTGIGDKDNPVYFKPERKSAGGEDIPSNFGAIFNKMKNDISEKKDSIIELQKQVIELQKELSKVNSRKSNTHTSAGRMEGELKHTK